MLLEVENVIKRFPVRGGFLGKPTAYVHAVNGVSLHVKGGETLGIVGESGCGKSTLARLIVRLLAPDAGAIRFDGQDLVACSRSALRAIRRDLQIVFQDPFGSLNPRMTVGDIVAEPLVIHDIGAGGERRRRVEELLTLVGLSGDVAHRYPHEFSGGQRQRIGIARAIALQPKCIVADEPVSALDVSVQGEVLNLLMDLQRTLAIAYVFIAHDIKVVAQVSHRIAVMYLGQIVEELPAEKLLEARHPYTRALLAAVPIADPTRRERAAPLGGDVPSPITLPPGCPFHPRCKYREANCLTDPPALLPQGPNHRAACHYVDKVLADILP
ncbi:MAG: ATP-binding cassette domain-containing protein [Deltaproteobacteria bacterium]|nr:ATP-binding cassette domain-containing protein [Deltaproteobacteria bacterium]